MLMCNMSTGLLDGVLCLIGADPLVAVFFLKISKDT